jgi:hypothetical protein
MNRPSNDAVRCLAVLSGLLCLDPSTFSVPIRSQGMVVLQNLPQPSPNYLFTARIATADGRFLPTEYASPRSLIRLFQGYDLKAVAFNHSGYLKNNGIRFWWVSVETIESLQRLVADVHGSYINGKTLVMSDNTIHSAKFSIVLL